MNPRNRSRHSALARCSFSDVPALSDPRERFDYFDTRRFGKSAAGHLFPDALSEEEKQAVLEYLKTL